MSEETIKITKFKDQYFYNAYNIFSSSIVEKISISCDKHFEYNKNEQSDFLEITDCIVDCHGLKLSGDFPNEYPYKEEHWNIFCTQIKHYVLEYAKISNINVDKMIPHSCWSERIINYSNPTLYELMQFFLPYTEEEPWEYAKDGEMYDIWNLEKPLIRAVYYLKNPNINCGTHVDVNGEIYVNLGIENSLFIFDGGNFPSANPYPSPKDLVKKSKYNIIFDWYINEPYHDPAWILP